MAEIIKPAPLTEPIVVDCHLVEGVEIEVRASIVRIVGWIELETVKDGSAPERRIVSRIAMPTEIARALIRDLRRVVVRAGEH
jgi:hypothetical protein